MEHSGRRIVRVVVYPRPIELPTLIQASMPAGRMSAPSAVYFGAGGPGGVAARPGTSQQETEERRRYGGMGPTLAELGVDRYHT